MEVTPVPIGASAASDRPLANPFSHAKQDVDHRATSAKRPGTKR
jgi:hypothetical protein